MTDPSDKTPKAVNEVGWMNGCKLNLLTRVDGTEGRRDCSGVLECGGAGGAQAVP